MKFCEKPILVRQIEKKISKKKEKKRKVDFY